MRGPASEHPAMAVALPALLAAAVYVGTLANGLVYDDPLAMARGHESLGDLIGRRNGLTYLTVSLDHRLWGAWIPGFHLTNVFLHALASALVALCARMLGGRGWTALLCGLLFAVHPVHVEAVASIENRKEILTMIFSAVSLCAYRERRRERLLYAVSLLALVLALASKEVAAIGLVIMLPLAGLLPAGDATRPRAAVWRVLPLLLVGALATGWYATRSRRPAVPASVGTSAELRIASAASVPTMARLLVFPDRLSADYPRPAQTSTTRYRAMGAALVVTIWIVAAVALARRSPLTAFAMAWPVVMYLPLANLVPLTPFFVAERYLYVPSFGICLLVALGIERLRQRAAPLALGLAVLLVAAGAARSAIRVPEWHDALALWSSAARAFPDGSSKIHGELGFALLTAGRDAEAIPHLHRAIAIGPAEADTHSNLGLAFWRTGDRDAAIQEMTRAVAKMPENQMIRYNLALMLFQSGRLDEAEPHMRILASAEAWTDVHPSVRAALAKQGSSPAQLQADIRRWLTARDGAAHP